MRKIIVVAASLGLAGCSSFSMPSMDMFKSTPPNTTIQLESLPAGADARTSGGQSCKTPCALSVPAGDNFSVTFSLPKYQSETVPVQVLRQTSETGALTDPNPVYAELQPAIPPKSTKAAAKPKSAAAPKAKKPKAGAAPAAPAADGQSPFPPPTR